MKDLRMVQPLLDLVFGEVKADPNHKMSPLRRREVYKILSNHMGKRSLQRLAIMSAQKVLPIFQQKYPNDTMPKELIETANKYLLGQIEEEIVKEKLDLGSHASGNAWGYDEREIPWPVWLAGNASYHALNEVYGCRPLMDLPEYYKGDALTAWSDEDLCEYSFTDTAAVAAVASSANPNGKGCDSQKLLEFWTWWLTEAIPKGIETK